VTTVLKSLVILRSENGRDGWKPVLPADVPEWLKNPDVMHKLVNGEMAMDPRKGTEWYRAEERVVH
jgi:hypothetical protein